MGKNENMVPILLTQNILRNIKTLLEIQKEKNMDTKFCIFVM